jgi:hypothetical protein
MARNPRNGPSAANTDEELEKELAREAAEGASLSGDMHDNRNVSGSSSWETIMSSSPVQDGDERGEVF